MPKSPNMGAKGDEANWIDHIQDISPNVDESTDRGGPRRVLKVVFRKICEVVLEFLNSK